MRIKRYQAAPCAAIAATREGTRRPLAPIATPQPAHLDERTAELRRRFAYAIARRGAKALLDQNNNGVGWRSIEAAVASGMAFAVDVAPDVLPIDMDDPADAPSLMEFADQCRAAHVVPVIVA